LESGTVALPSVGLGSMMGVWFATTFPAGILAGYLGGFWSSMAEANFFLMIAMIAALAGTFIGALSRGLRSMLEGPVSASTDRSA
jgi:POT family proton-dependent oligopeptide transporter